MSDADHTTSVEFRTIARHVGYRFGSDGTVWSCWKKFGLPGQKGSRAEPVGLWRLMKPHLQPKTKYLMAYLKNPEGPGFVNRLIHRLIAEAFHGPCPEGMECCHNDGNRSNNRADNLRWDTRTNNHADRIQHGTRRTRLTAADVLEIRAASRAGESKSSLSRRFRVYRKAIYAALYGKTWAHV